MPHDSAYFHRITEGHCVIMGRKNYEANRGALPGRTNIVITRQHNFNPADAIVVNSAGEAVKIASNLKEEEAFIVGGGEIYRLTLDITDRIYITIIDTFAEGDTYYPELDFSKWDIISEIPMKKDTQNPYDYTYYILERP